METSVNCPSLTNWSSSGSSSSQSVAAWSGVSAAAFSVTTAPIGAADPVSRASLSTECCSSCEKHAVAASMSSSADACRGSRRMPAGAAAAAAACAGDSPPPLRRSTCQKIHDGHHQQSWRQHEHDTTQHEHDTTLLGGLRTSSVLGPPPSLETAVASAWRPAVVVPAYFSHLICWVELWSAATEHGRAGSHVTQTVCCLPLVKISHRQCLAATPRQQLHACPMPLTRKRPRGQPTHRRQQEPRLRRLQQRARVHGLQRPQCEIQHLQRQQLQDAA